MSDENKSGGMKTTLEFIREIANSSEFLTDRRFRDLLVSRLRQACTQPTLLSAAERLASLLGTKMQYVRGDVAVGFIGEAHSTEAPRVLEWLRRYPSMAAMLLTVKKDEWMAAADAIVLPAAASNDARIVTAPDYDIPITVECLSPLAHGADEKAGNATLFRRCLVQAGDGGVLNLPFYGGNAIRGQLRDLLADDFLAAMGLGRKQLALWFFYVLYSGGTLEESSKATSAIAAALGKNGILRTDGLREFRDRLPHLSLLGAAMGNRILSGRICVGDFRPRCYQWGTGELQAHELMDWQYLTRREDDESHEENHSMIATTECLRTGTVLNGGIDVSRHAQSAERSALGRGLKLLGSNGRIGAENRRGFGSVKIEASNVPDASEYETYLKEQTELVLEYLHDIGALATEKCE